MDFKELKTHCQNLAYEGKDFLDIQREVDRLNPPRTDREAVMQLIDDYIIRYEFWLQEKQKSLQKMLIGVLLVFIGGGAWIAGVAENGITKSMVVTLILFGANMTRTAWNAYGQPIDDNYFKKRKFKSGDMRKFYDR